MRALTRTELVFGIFVAMNIGCSAQTGTITTVAGNGTVGFSGDGGQATAAQLTIPTGVAVDSVGNVYIADAGAHRIRKVSAAGVISTVAGNGNPGYSGDGGPAIAAQLSFPLGVAVDSARTWLPGLASARTVHPRASNFRATCQPMKPVAPVTRVGFTFR